MATRVRAEWDRLRRLAVHRPGMEMWLGLLAPRASLYERAFSRYEARREHERLEYALTHEFKVEVVRLKEKLLELADRKPEVREKLIALALRDLKYAGNPNRVDQAQKQLKESLPLLDSGQFFYMLIFHPELELEEEEGARAVDVRVTARQPLTNLYFMRDQQATTDRGIFLSRMSKPQRREEPIITRFLWESLGETIVHETEAPGTFEGGDFMPMKDFALLGLGDRTNASGVKQFLEHGLGFKEVALVHQPAHPLIPGDEPDRMVTMHLDTYFNVAGSGVAVGSETLLKRAAVEIYYREGKGVFKKPKAKATNLHDYIKGKGFSIIDLTTLEQLSDASNFLCIKDGTILAVEVDRQAKNVLESLSYQAKQHPNRYGRLLDQAQKDYQHLKETGGFFPHKREIYHHGIDAFPITLTNLTGGYGGPHCMTAILERG